LLYFYTFKTGFNRKNWKATAMKKENKVLVVLAFGAIYIVWGTTYLAILFGLEGFPPFVLSTFRFILAGALMLGWCLAHGARMPALRDLWVPVVSGVVMLVGGSGLVTWAEQYVTTSQAAIMIATEPFLFLLLDKKRWGYYFSGKRVILGLLIGFSGIVLFFLFATHQKSNVVPPYWKAVGYAVLFLSALLWVCGSLYAKSRTPAHISNTVTTAVQLVSAGLFSAVLAGATGEWTTFTLHGISAKAWGGVLYLVVMGSLVAYLSFTWLLSIRPPAVVSTHTYVNPVVAVVMGWLVAHEQITFLQVGALVLILGGVMLVNKNTVTEKPATPKPAVARAQ
jgi:drug/metabolite transporter (DMT)-like permease